MLSSEKNSGKAFVGATRCGRPGSNTNESGSERPSIVCGIAGINQGDHSGSPYKFNCPEATEFDLTWNLITLSEEQSD